MTRHRLLTCLALVGVVLLPVIAPPALAQQAMNPPDPTVREIHAGETVHVALLPGQVYLRSVNDPDSIVWDRIPTYRTFLTEAPPVHRSTLLRFDPKEGEYLYFQFARTAGRFYVRLRWQDSSENRKTTVNQFRDGAAIEFALDGVDTSYMMGSGPKKPVNIWYWHPDRDEVENLAAGGYGSTTSLPEQPVSGQSTYQTKRNSRDNQWHVVMSRKLDSTGKYQVDLQKGTIPVAFAVWQGAEEQRDGNKRVSNNWILVDLQPTKAKPQRAAKASAGAAGTDAASARKVSRPAQRKVKSPGVKSKAAPKAG
ncbi:MAG: dimethylsulfide dehydrogenase [Candidimonas sp.]|nr:MAG: dimethylsulfide dehydrogenase [Candidimonas sp.]TAM21908.1 MAG: dimethylsulfide dehydrogenase [Candidimonas sp.]